MAIEQGLIESALQRASDFIDEWRADDRANITIQQILDMRSGLVPSARALKRQWWETVVISSAHPPAATSCMPRISYRDALIGTLPCLENFIRGCRRQRAGFTNQVSSTIPTVTPNCWEKYFSAQRAKTRVSSRNRICLSRCLSRQIGGETMSQVGRLTKLFDLLLS